MTKCPVCRTTFGPGAIPLLAQHFLVESGKSDPAHVRFLNQSISRHRMDAVALAARFEELFRLPEDGLPGWIRQRFIARFFGPRLHPFVEALQYPTRPTLLGYVVEHQHFLREWVRCCAFVLAKSDSPEVADYEIDNIRTEYAGEGPEVPSHYEMLLRMGESYGVDRETVLGTEPLPTTARALAEWHDICEKEPWVEAMAAMHSLELIAHRDLVKFGATVHYFDPEILDGSQITEEAKAFLREGYEADVEHADRALALVDRFAQELGCVEEVQATFLRSLDLFDDYLGARLQRGEEYGSPA
jgi:pyrroloquinoline-quinone synthase